MTSTTPAVRPNRDADREMFAQLAATAKDDPERGVLRDSLVTRHLPLAEYFARRFRDRGEPLEDLSQVAVIGLIKAVDRFELDREVEFATYAAPTILGEIRRHFRDRGWAIHVPRRLQELQAATSAATARLSQDLGRSPTVAELAVNLGLGEDAVLDGLESARAYRTISLDTLGEAMTSIGDRLGDVDGRIEEVDLRESIRPLLNNLGERERRIVVLRFFHEMTQSQIAEDVGLSQMHVSRLLARSLALLRESLQQGQAMESTSTTIRRAS